MTTPNPYNWQGHRPKVEVERLRITELALDELLAGGSAVVLGGHGTGKSVLLRQLSRHLTKRGVHCVLFERPPSEISIAECIRAISSALNYSGTSTDLEVILDSALTGFAKPLALLYDEADRYCRAMDNGTNVGRALFNSLESARRDLSPNVGLLVAGGLGLFGLRDELGSNFISRAAWVLVEPLSRDEALQLATPLTSREGGVDQEVIDSVLIAAGRNAALMTYGLQSLWKEGKPSLESVVAAFSTFSDKYSEFINQFWRSLNDPVLSQAPSDAWNALVRHGSPIERRLLLEELQGDGELDLNLDDALRMLRAAGLIEVDGPVSSDPLVARPLLSILTLPMAREAASNGTFEERLAKDLVRVLENIYALGSDFFRPKSTRDPQGGLVPESVFSATLTIALRQLGWNVEREAVKAAGRTDLLVTHSALAGAGIIEMKIWERNDYERIHEQVESYWVAESTIGFAVMLSDKPPEDWPGVYRRKCLKDRTIKGMRGNLTQILDDHLEVSSSLPSGRDVRVQHLLVRVPQRAKK